MKKLLCLIGVALGATSALASSPPSVSIPGRLFYTPAQRAMLNHARLNKLIDQPKTSATMPAPEASVPVSFDGVITRSDGVATHWIDGRPHVGRSSDRIRNLKPGQTRAAQKVYESYQIRQSEPVRITPPAPTKSTLPEEAAP